MKKRLTDEIPIKSLLKKWESLTSPDREIATGILRRVYYTISKSKRVKIEQQLARDKNPLAKKFLEILTKPSE